MEEFINIIMNKQLGLFEDNPNVEKINVGFTNTIYNVNNKYIIKICSDTNNEPKFQKEIDFYNANKDNNLIPKLYYSDTSKQDIPYFYEILEKIGGVTLYNVWHTLSETEREDVIRQLCDAMKKMHSNVGKTYDWLEYNKNEYNKSIDKVIGEHLLTEEELNILNQAYSLFDKYLTSDEMVLIHNDLHFDNIFIKDGNIKIIDFERSMYTPRDYELGIIYRMIRKPWKFASEECEEYTKLEDYENIMEYIEKYYPELIHIPNLYKRLAIYDLIYELPHFIKFVDSREETKEMIFECAKTILEGE
jgi:serine/threonine protein kinase